MATWGNVLVVDDSKVCRKLLETVLSPHCDAVLSAGSPWAAIETLESQHRIDLVLCDVVMRAGSGFEVLEYVATRPDPKPRVLMLSAYQADGAAEDARRLGAVGFLTKPTTLRRIHLALEASERGERRELNPRWRCSGKALLVDDASGGPGSISWDVYNISVDGAFLETKGPIPIGTDLDLLLEIDGGKGRVQARVVRIQEPSWFDVGGVGVTFVKPSDEAEELIAGVLRASEPEY